MVPVATSCFNEGSYIVRLMRQGQMEQAWPKSLANSNSGDSRRSRPEFAPLRACACVPEVRQETAAPVHGIAARIARLRQGITDLSGIC